MQVFYVNIGGGEPTIRRDFWDLLAYATAHHVGVKFSTNGSRITRQIATRLAANDYVDVQISFDGATAEIKDRVRGAGSYATALAAMEHLRAAGRSLQGYTRRRMGIAGASNNSTRHVRPDLASGVTRLSRVALVTGASRGIGAATIAQLDAAGWCLVAVDRASDDPRLPYALGTANELDAVVGAASNAGSPC
jgi:3-oxoacyl-ACP reductase-like protein